MSNDPRCGRCRRRVIMARTVPGEQIIRLDAEPTTAGHYELDLDALPMPTARRVRFGEVSPAVAAYLGGDLLYIHHSEVCSVQQPEDGDRDDVGAEPQEAGG